MITKAREVSSGSFLVLGALAYALLCAALLVGNIYLGVAAALVPGLAVFFSQAGIGIATAVSARRASLAWILLLVAALPWQTVAVTSTGLVSTGSEASVAKFAVTGLGVALAFLAGVPRLTYKWPLKALLAYALIAAVGGFTSIDPYSSLLRSARFILIVLAIVWVTSRLTRPRLAALFIQFSVAISLLALFGRAMGLVSSKLYAGRLAGYLPPLHPNLIGMLAAAGLLCVAALLTQRQLSPSLAALAAPILGVALVLSQSRTSMIALVIGLLALGSSRLTTRGLLIVGIVSFAFVVAAFVQTNTESRPVTSLLTHNGNTTTTSTLNSRLSEWDAVLKLNNTTLTQAIGQGLTTKTVEVSLSSAQYAPVDGSWPAAYLSAGLIGVLILGSTVIGGLRAAVQHRDEFAVTIIVFLIISSMVTDVFNDVTIGLFLFLASGIGTFAAPRQGSGSGWAIQAFSRSSG